MTSAYIVEVISSELLKTHPDYTLNNNRQEAISG